VKEVGSIDWISTSKAREVKAISGGLLLGLCILFLDRVIIGWEFDCLKLGSSGALKVEGRH
jgi:hypothetical protein